MSEHIDYVDEWHNIRNRILEEHENDLEDRLLGKIVAIRYRDELDLFKVKDIAIKISKLEYAAKESYCHNDLILYDSQGIRYKPDPVFGIKVFDL
ncbi:MAG: hypothetical protein ACLFPQ_04230 [Candidatus Woesearchaeota archaeon]